MDSEFDRSFKYCSRSLQFIGAHPFETRNILWAAKATFLNVTSTFLIFFLCVYSLVVYDLKYNITNAFADACLVIVYFVITFMYIVMMQYRDTFVELMNTVSRHHIFYKARSEKEQQIIAKYIKIAQTAERLWAFITVLCVISFLGQPVITMMFLAFNDRFEFIPVLNLYYPSWIRGQNEHLVYITMWGLTIVVLLFVTGTYTAVVPLGPICMFHACGQIEICKTKVESLFLEDKLLSGEERSERISDIVKQTQEVFHFVELLKTSLMFLYELTLKGTSLIMPVLLFETLVTLKQGEIRSEFIGVFMGSLIISSIPCYSGEVLLGKSEELRDAIYACGWERVWDKGARVSLQFMLVRFERPTVIRSVFRTISLQALAEVFQTAYSLFNLINAGYEA